jgi:hypothetical protein
LKKRKIKDYSELKDLTEIESRLIESRLSLYSEESQQLTQGMMLEFFRYKSNAIFEEISEQLAEER